MAKAAAPAAVDEETQPYIKDHNGTQICFADTITQAINALRRTGLANPDDAKKLEEKAHLMLFGVETFNNMKGFKDAFSDKSKNTFTRLEIFGCEMDNAAQLEMANAFAPDAMENIKTLDLDNTALTKDGAAAIFRKIAECRSIGRLNLQGSIASQDVMKSISTALTENCNLFGSLYDLDLKINDLKAGAAEHISNIMQRLQPLKFPVKVDLFYNDLGEDGAKHIATALQSDGCAVAHLDMCCNNIGDKGAVAIGKALVMNRSLETLKLALNNIGNEGGIEILRAILPFERDPKQAINRTLKTLDLSANVMKEEIGKNNAGIEVKSADMVKMEARILQIDERLLEIEFADGVEKEVQELQTERADIAARRRALQPQDSPLIDQLIEVAQKSVTLTDLDITGIEFDGTGWAKFATGLTAVPNTKTVRFSIVDLMSEENLKTVEEKIWNDKLKDQYRHIDWRRRDDAVPAKN